MSAANFSLLLSAAGTIVGDSFGMQKWTWSYLQSQGGKIETCQEMQNDFSFKINMGTRMMSRG